MKNLKLTAVLVLGIAIGFSANNFAISDVPVSYKVAVVDVPAVVAKSKQVANLKKDEQKKLNDLKAFVKSANATIAKEKNATKKKSLEQKYNKELQTKKDAITKNYQKSLAVIDKNISNTIKANSRNYHLVLAKSVVLSGGTDITAHIAKVVK